MRKTSGKIYKSMNQDIGLSGSDLPEVRLFLSENFKGIEASD
jgi:hypothetical protein